MLINEPMVLSNRDPLLAMIAELNGRDSRSMQIDTGLYEIGHHGSSSFMPGYEQYPDLGNAGPYGVCDDPSQVLNAIPELMDDTRKFVVLFTRVVKSDQPRDGGWRWHKWGDYIGTKEPTTEYLHDEPEIERVFCYHVYEKISD